MNCSSIRDQAPLYLSGEMRGEERRTFDAHLAACPACAREIEHQALVDARLMRTLGQDLPDASRIERSVRRRISAARSRRWIAAGAAAAIAASVGLWMLAQPPRLYVDAARDHEVEVVRQQPRRWRYGVEAIGALAVQSGLSFEQASALAPPGYSLERAKFCGLAGNRMLHMVFRNGARKYSVYVRPHPGSKQEVRMVRRDTESVAGFETERFQAFVVTSGAPSECEELARRVAGLL